ncbi:MAG: EAL domain-containing protein [Ruminococcus sp.]|nr:EAL domain-containing protein [Ruminococcus sp.]
MKSVNLIYSTEQELENFIMREKLDISRNYFIRIHTCIHTKENIRSFVEMILRHFPNAKIIGSSTSGVIYNGDIHTDCCMISITEFEFSEVDTCLCSLSKEIGSDMRGSVLADNVIDAVVNDSSKFMLVLFARPFMKVGRFVERFNERSKNVQLIGGIANTPQNPNLNIKRDAFVFDNDSVSDNCVAVAVINSKKISVYSDIVYVTEPVGICHTITDADGMIIRAIDGENAVNWYMKQLGISSLDKTDYNMTALFPLVRVNHGETPWALSYSPQTEEFHVFDDEPEPVMFVPSEAKAGEIVKISYSSIQKTIEVCEDVCNNISSHAAEVLFGYSCVSRQTLFMNCAKWELMPFENTNLSGCLVVGEIGNMNTRNQYCNYSFAVSALSESARRIKIDTDILRRKSGELINKQEHIVKYLVNMNKQSEENSSLSQRQHEIEETLFKDDETGIGNITKYSYDFSMGRFDKICMLSCRNENLLNAFMSKSKFNASLKRFYRSIIEFIGDKPLSCYIYKKTYLIITCSPSVCDGEFVDMMHSVQNFVSEYKFGEYFPVSEFSIVMHEEDMINKAELTLLSMRQKKEFFLHYTSDLGLEQINARKLKMLKILNDAVANDRVIPYFQGIRDNSSGNINMYESLMRIADEDGNIYNPAQFMETAKDYGFYSDISYLMIIKVMKLFRDRRETVTINLNISDINNYKIVHFIVKYLKNAPHPENYVFELTETEEIRDYQIIAEFVEQIHQLGSRIAIDDFGSGFSNIVNIFKVKSDFIKIDGEIVRNIKNDIYAREFLEMIAEWSVRHGKQIVAEYIENQDIQDIIHRNGIRFSQGYLFSKPNSFLPE